MQQQQTEDEAPAFSATSSPTAVLLKQAVGICGSVLGNIENARMETTEDATKMAALFEVVKGASQVVMNLRQARTAPNLVLQPPSGGLLAPQIFGGQSSLMPSPSQPFGNPSASLGPHTITRPAAVPGLSSQRLFSEEHDAQGCVACSTSLCTSSQLAGQCMCMEAACACELAPADTRPRGRGHPDRAPITSAQPQIDQPRTGL